MVKLDILTKNAITHTRHCLTGCGIGEVLGSVIGTALTWPNAGQTGLAVVLAFGFGYGLTYRGAVNSGKTPKDAFKTALAVDTISIISMEIIDNIIEYVVPGAMNAKVNAAIFWWSLALSLTIAFIFTVPVNRFVMARSPSGHSH